MAPLVQSLRTTIEWVSTAPPLGLFLALALLPLFGFPASPLWVAMGIRMGTWWGSVLAMLALLINFSCGYGLASRLGRGRLRTWMERRGKPLPVMAASDETRWILLIRLTPGLPLFMQNYMLGMAAVNFPRYLLLSLPVQMIYAVLFISLGTSLSGSRLWHGILAISGVIAIGLLVSQFRALISRSHQKTTTPEQ